MNKAKQDGLLGLVFFAGLALLLWATYALTDLSLESRPTLEIYARDAGHLRAGDAVFVLGNRNGQVISIEDQPDATDPDRRLVISVELARPVTLKQDVEIRIGAANLLGGKILQIDPGIDPTLHPEGSPLFARLQANGLDALGDLLDDPQMQEDFRAIIAGIRTTVDKLNDRNSGSLGRLINDTTLYDDFLGATQSARRSLEELEKAESPLGRLIYSEEDGRKLGAAIDSIESIARKIDTGEGIIARLVNDVKLAENVDQVIADAAEIIRDLKDGKGTMGLLFRDDELAQKVSSAISEFEELGRLATDPEAGLVGALVADKELRDLGAKFIADLEAVGEEIRNGNGLLARLINDEDMGNQLARVLNQVSRAIEDAREAAPVGTFFQVLSGAF